MLGGLSLKPRLMPESTTAGHSSSYPRLFFDGLAYMMHVNEPSSPHYRDRAEWLLHGTRRSLGFLAHFVFTNHSLIITKATHGVPIYTPV